MMDELKAIEETKARLAGNLEKLDSQIKEITDLCNDTAWMEQIRKAQ